MTYLLIIFLYKQGVVIEAHYPDLATCERFEDKAHQWASPVVTECKRADPKIDPRR